MLCCVRIFRRACGTPATRWALCSSGNESGSWTGSERRTRSGWALQLFTRHLSWSRRSKSCRTRAWSGWDGPPRGVWTCRWCRSRWWSMWRFPSLPQSSSPQRLTVPLPPPLHHHHLLVQELSPHHLLLHHHPLLVQELWPHLHLLLLHQPHVAQRLHLVQEVHLHRLPHHLRRVQEVQHHHHHLLHQAQGLHHHQLLVA